MGRFTKKMLRRVKGGRMSGKELHAMPMRFDFTQQPQTLSGKPLKIPVLDEDDKQVFKKANLGEICKWALLEVAEPNKDSRDAMGNHPQKVLDGDEKFERYRLAQKLHEGGTIPLENKERDLIRKLVGHGFNIEAVGVIWDLLDKPLPEEDDADDDAAEEPAQETG
jgi:hypothetical protein